MGHEPTLQKLKRQVLLKQVDKCVSVHMHVYIFIYLKHFFTVSPIFQA